MSRPPKARPIHLVLDFDGTLTQTDTMHLVANAGYAHQHASGTAPQPPPWSVIVDAYMADLRAYTHNYRPQINERTTPKQESAWLDSLKQVENASFQRVLQARIFDNVTSVEMEGAGNTAIRHGNLHLRAGWEKLALHIHRYNGPFPHARLPVHVLSVHWSATFIRGVLNQVFRGLQLLEPPIHDRDVYANEIPSIDGERLASPNHHYPLLAGNAPSIQTSGDKYRLLQKLHQSIDDKGDTTLVYIGDSTTDLDCLLGADIGVCIRDDPIGSGQKDLADTCQRIGVVVRPITELPDQGDKEKKTLWWTKDFSEVDHWLSDTVKG